MIKIVLKQNECHCIPPILQVPSLVTTSLLTRPQERPNPCVWKARIYLIDNFLLLSMLLPQAGYFPPQCLILTAREEKAI